MTYLKSGLSLIGIVLCTVPTWAQGEVAQTKNESTAGQFFELSEYERVQSSIVQMAYDHWNARLTTWLAQDPARRDPECLVDDSGRCIFLPPLPVTPGPGSRSDRSWIYARTWIPASTAPEYAAQIQRWKALASSGAVYGCNHESRCRVVVEAIPPDDREEVLAICATDKLDASIGAVHGCEATAWLTANQQWIRVLSGREIVWSGANGGPDFVIGIIARPTLKTAALLKNIEETLEDRPFDLSLRNNGRGFLAVATKRSSSILEGWREMVTLRIDLEGDRDDGLILSSDVRREPASMKHPVGFGITLSSTLYLNRQNTDREVDWHLPSREQEMLYVDTAKKQLKKSLNALCSRPLWRADLLFCDLPTSTPVPNFLGMNFK